MTFIEASVQYIKISINRKSRFLASLAYELTIWMRDQDGVEIVQRAHKLAGANELQHHFSSQLRHHLDNDLNCYPDDVFMSILSDKAAYYTISPELEGAMTKCLQRADEQDI